MLTGHDPPRAFTADADLGEWGSLAGRQGSQHPDGSYLAIAVSRDAILVGALLREPFSGGIWLGLATDPPDLPEPYDSNVNGYTIPVTENECRFVSVCCPSGDVELTGKPRPRAVTARCLDALSRYRELVSRLAKRHTRQLKLEASGVSEVLESGKLEPIAAAKAVWKTRPKGVSVEVSLPLSALPRLSTPALADVRAWAGASGRPLAEARSKPIDVAFPNPVRFQPHAELREALMALQGKPNRLESYGSFLYGKFGISYRADDPEHFEILEHRTKMELSPKQLGLHTKASNVGAYDLGETKAPIRMLEISKQGKTLGAVRWDHAEQRAFLLDGKLIVAWYEPGYYEWMVASAVPPAFHAVDFDQQPPKDLVDRELESNLLSDCQDQWSLPPGRLVVSANSDTWAWSGGCAHGSGKGAKRVRFTATWRWNKSKGQFETEWKQLP